MEAIRRIEQLQGNQLSLALPEFFRGKKVEVIVLPYQERTTEASSTPYPRRTPSPRLRGAIKMTDDLIAPVVAADEDLRAQLPIALPKRADLMPPAKTVV